MWYREKNDRSKDTLKKIVPATYSQVESADNKIVKEIKNLMKETKGLEHDISALKKEIETIGN